MTVVTAVRRRWLDAAVFLRRFRLATAMAVAGVGVYFLARAVKEVFQRGWWKLVPVTLLVIVGFGRMFVAAHVPLDLIGGAALEAAAGALANLFVDTPTAAGAERRSGAGPSTVVSGH